ncbi:MAG: HEAT repeat domain-containing protein, partial [Gemmataceae bacterium]
MSLQIQCNGCSKVFRANLPDENGLLCPLCGHEVVPAKNKTRAHARFKPNWQLWTAIGGLSVGLIATVGFGLSMPREKSLHEQDLPIPLVKLDSDLDVLAQTMAPRPSKVETPPPPPAPAADPEPVQEKVEPVRQPIAVEVIRAVTEKMEETAEEQPAGPKQPTKVRSRVKRTDEELRKQLLLVNIMGNNDIPLASRVTLANAPKTRRYQPHERPDFAGLPMRMGIDCQLGKEPAETMQHLSRKLRESIAAAMQGGVVVDADKLRQILMSGIQLRRGRIVPAAAKIDDQPVKIDGNMWLRVEAVPTLVQMLTPESKDVRLLLVDMLAEIPGHCATEALVQRALYDLSSEVREAAVQVLDSRPRSDYRDTLLQGLRYPWSPVADHAAEALAALKDTDAVPSLLNLLDAPNPKSPFVTSDNQFMMREL